MSVVGGISNDLAYQSTLRADFQRSTGRCVSCGMARREGDAMNCPTCNQPVEDHWSLKLSEKEFDRWNLNQVVCPLMQGEVLALCEGVAS